MSLNVIGLSVKNIKQIRTVELKGLKGKHVIEVRGANNQGKSSLLDSVFLAILPTSNRTKIAKRIGENEAKIVLDLGEVVVTRFFKDDKITLSIASGEGTIKAPQKWLNERIGKNNFDPTKFVQMNADERFKLLTSVCGITTQYEEIQSNITELIQERRDLKNTKTNITVTTTKPDEEQLKLGTKQYDTTTLVNELINLSDIQDKQVSLQDNLKQLIKKFKKAEKQINEEIHKLDKKSKKLTTKLVKKYQYKKDDMINLDLQHEIVSLQNTTKTIRNNIIYKENTAKLVKVDKAIQDCNISIANKQQDIQNLLEETTVTGLEKLEFTADRDLLWDGVPIENLSSSEQILIGVTIALNEKPEINIVNISDGSLLGKSILKQINKLAKKFNATIFIEFMDESGKGEIVMKGGYVK